MSNANDIPSISVESLQPPSGAPADRDDLFAWAMRQVLKECRKPSNKKMFLPSLLVGGPMQPYHVKEWTVENLGSKVSGSGAICSGTGLGKPNPKKSISLHLTDLTVNGIANVKPTDWTVKPNEKKSKDLADVTVDFCAFGEKVLPKGVDSNLVISSHFTIKQPCIKYSGDDPWTAVGKGTVKIAIKKATGHSRIVFYTTGSGSNLKLHAEAKEITFQIDDLSGCDGVDGSEKRLDDGSPAVSVDVNVTNIHEHRKRWLNFIKNAVNSHSALCTMQSKINTALGGKAAKQHLGKTIVKKINEVLSS